jgi:hypothetical protein
VGRTDGVSSIEHRARSALGEGKWSLLYCSSLRNIDSIGARSAKRINHDPFDAAHSCFRNVSTERIKPSWACVKVLRDGLVPVTRNEALCEEKLPLAFLKLSPPAAEMTGTLR